MKVHSLRQRPELVEAAIELHHENWPVYLVRGQGPEVMRRWLALYKTFSDFQHVVLEGDKMLALVNAAPICWDGTREGLPAGWDGTLDRAFRDRKAGREPDSLVGLGITVHRDHQGQGISKRLVQRMRHFTQRCGYRFYLAPARPLLKYEEPDLSLTEYLHLRRSDGWPEDPWIRVHARLGARVSCLVENSRTVSGSIAEWEHWTGMQLSQSGHYLIPEGLAALDVRREEDLGIYSEDHVWMLHSMHEPMVS